MSNSRLILLNLYLGKVMLSQSLHFESLPADLAKKADMNWQQFLDQITQNPKYHLPIMDEQVSGQIKAIMGMSDFVSAQLCRNPEWLYDLLDDINVKHADIDCYRYNKELMHIFDDIHDDEQAKFALRHYRNHELCRLAWRDYLRLFTTESNLISLSVLAESLIITARNYVYAQMCIQYGTPQNAKGKPQPLLVLGMGKLGGRELNFSSDIDLIFTFPEHGETFGTRRVMENQQFFTRMGQKLVHLLEQSTLDGFVYRVDMRLRPYGESGALAMSFSALEDYYQEQGRDWERYAMVKARVLGPWNEYADELHSLLRPFIYRRYIDFSVIDSLRKMKQLITNEVRRRGLNNNIKLGPGGIREVEFIVQSFQLIRGGMEPNLRESSILHALSQLQINEHIDGKTSNELRQHYLLLRRIENLLQSFDDKQTQTLPETEIDWQRLFVVMGAKSKKQLQGRLQKAMASIHFHFMATIGGENHKINKDNWTVALWQKIDNPDSQAILSAHGVNDDILWHKLHQWYQELKKRTLGPRGRDTLDKLMPKLLDDLLTNSNPSNAFLPVSNILNKILTRTTYLELLYENERARQQLILLCCASPWIAEQLAYFPMLLDELIDPITLYHTPAINDYPQELQEYLMRIPKDDLEQQMEALRQFKLSQQLKIAAADVTGVLAINKVSDQLTYLAQAMIEQVVIQSWQQLVNRYGAPDHLATEHRGFAIIGYGKLGGYELGYGSDLDLVFLHNAPANGHTLGDKSISSGHFYLKLAQRILHLFSTRTLSGELYEVDMRLRPSGTSGLLVSEIEHYQQYQLNNAWTWEHQSLVRARFIFGDKLLNEQFNAIRKNILSLPRDTKTLRQEVSEMRNKMRSHLLTNNENKFDLKQSAGGMVDIEFIAQYLVLANAHQFPQLTYYSDNIRIFNELSKLTILPKEISKLLRSTYCMLRNKTNRLVLQGHKIEVNIDEVAIEIEPISAIYQSFFGEE